MTYLKLDLLEFGMNKIFTLCFIFSFVHQSLCLNPEDTSTFFPNISGMHKVGLPEIFVPENLYEYINGAAESYLIYEFRDLAVQIYENKQKQSVTVEVYRHQNPVHSFGIYSQERPQQSNFLNIGSQAYFEPSILNFLKGNYYVKISTHDFANQDQSILKQFAEQIERKLKGDGILPPILSWFPVEGKIENSERFISQNFLGYSFLKNVFTADYEVPKNKFTLFLLEANKSDECKRILESYLQSTNGLNEDIKEDHYTVDDPYQGTIGILWKDRYLLGIINLEPVEMRSNYLKLFEKKIQY